VANFPGGTCPCKELRDIVNENTGKPHNDNMAKAKQLAKLFAVAIEKCVEYVCRFS
jgi:hypothetical protein